MSKALPTNSDLILSIDTSSATVSAALLRAGKVVAEASTSVMTPGLSEAVLVLAEECFKSAAVSNADVAAIVVNIGPGSFTGIRNGIATAQGLAIERRLPVFGISSLLSGGLPFYVVNTIAAVSIQASRNETYLLLLAVGEQLNNRWSIEVLGDLHTVLTVDFESELQKRLALLPQTLNERQLLRVNLNTETSGEAHSTAVLGGRAANEINFHPSPSTAGLWQQFESGIGLDAVYVKAVNARTLVERGLR